MDYINIPATLFTGAKYKALSINAKWLYLILKHNEFRLCYYGEKGFFRTDAELANDTGFSLSTLKRAKAELLTASLVKCEQRHKIINEGKPTQKLSEQAFSWWYALK